MEHPMEDHSLFTIELHADLIYDMIIVKFKTKIKSNLLWYDN